MPIEVPRKPYQSLSANGKRLVDAALNGLLAHVSVHGNAEAKELLNDAPAPDHRQILIGLLNEGVLKLMFVRRSIGWAVYDDEKGAYLPFGPAMKFQPSPERN